ncbi:hypothetical protein LTR10_017916 [Elasticomyces elasticus]|uniref:Major facilitator superfamily (MFS) profile domain-containing protein n=1 Tax=Exophiala sideris TaxID=1016849 RepID=A0ABR0IWF2_9EURO|nr:hypothetical protein LTR10_017916 [Elasticomyces elasticus]KAK5021792.1 hypothetical protein LTS07_010687 [Exophiala sideris]KAK5025848.1 hypothetical protein LTR13_010312 [Exophiala sideris]KAK5050212.1 hypothetical protein LTR69_010700 [Exophiala sideris]KAK5177029.1 hypothetical protein LTR44_010466 [Eurotiomycetes sp. CCFEE 6388]
MATVTTTTTRTELTTSASVEPPILSSPAAEHGTQAEASSKGTTAAIFASITGVTGISSLLTGMVTVMLPKMAKDLDISDAVLLWPTSIYALTCGCSLILAGAVADVVGSRVMYLLGCFLQSVFTLACGLAQDSLQLILFRGLAGIAIAFCLPSAVSLITAYFPHGQRRNAAFAAMGGGQPIGFSIGLVIGGVLADGPGWRVGFYIAAAVNTVLLVVAFWCLPRVPQLAAMSFHRLRTEIDWPGALILSTSLGLLSYVFAALTGSVSSIRAPSTIACLSLAIVLIPVFVMWVGRQEKLGRPAIIPNSIWRNRIFTTVCIDVFLAWAAANALESLFSFFFQDVQRLTATQASLRFLPAPVAGVITNVIMGLAIHKINANWAVILTMAISSIAPILAAVMKSRDPYWEFALPALVLNDPGSDTLFTVSNLIITAAFPDKTQALAGAVFNTVSKIGQSVGLALCAVIAGSITRKSHDTEKTAPAALLEGYHAAFWFCLAITSTTLIVSLWGLRDIGKIGLKRE